MGPKSIHSAFSLFWASEKRKNQKRNERKLCEQLSHVDALTHFWPVFCICIAVERGDWNQTTKKKARKRLPTLLLLLNCRVILLSSLNNFHCIACVGMKMCLPLFRFQLLNYITERFRFRCRVLEINVKIKSAMSAWDLALSRETWAILRLKICSKVRNRFDTNVNLFEDFYSELRLRIKMSDANNRKIKIRDVLKGTFLRFY